MSSPENINTLNFPITTEEARRFWASPHKCNIVQAIIAFSLNLENANDNLRRYGYKYFWRKKALEMYGAYVNHPSMEGMFFFEPHIDYWHCLPYDGSFSDYLLTEDGIPLATEKYEPLLTESDTNQNPYKFIMTEDFYYLVTESGERLVTE